MTNRQEVAEKLRQAGESLRDSCCSGATVFVTVKDTIGLNDVSNRKAFFDRLADLIDPTCRIYYTDTSTNTPDTGYEPDGYYSCSCCGELHDLFAEAWDDYQAIDYEGEPPFRYCPHCGARVVRDEA